MKLDTNYKKINNTIAVDSTKKFWFETHLLKRCYDRNTFGHRYIRTALKIDIRIFEHSLKSKAERTRIPPKFTKGRLCIKLRWIEVCHNSENSLRAQTARKHHEGLKAALPLRISENLVLWGSLF